MSNEPVTIPKNNNLVGKALIFVRKLNWFGLSYPQKFTVIAIIFALPLIALAPLISDRFIRIDRYGYKEAQGAEYLRQVWQLTGDLQLFYSNVIKYDNKLESPEKIKEAQLKIDTDLITLESVGKKYNTPLGIDFDFNKFQAEWDSIKNGIQYKIEHGGAQLEGEKSHETKTSALNAKTDQLIKQIGDKSYLILDPDLDTYYMMETILIKLPENQSLLFELWRLSEEELITQDTTPDKLFKINSLISLIETNLIAIDQSIQTALKNNSSGFMSPIVFEPFQNYLTTTRSFTSVIRKNIVEAHSTQIDSKVMYTSYSRAIESGNVFYQAASKSLETGLQKRISALNFRLYASISFASLSIFTAFVIGINMMRSITHPLLKLISATEKLAAGELSTRIVVINSDEIGRASLAFNQMAEDMEKNRITLRAHAGELEQRSLELETIAEVGRDITVIRDLSTLLNVAANLIRERFKYYHVGIFLIDDNSEFAYLRAASGISAQQMLDQNYKLKIGQGSLVGNTIRTGQAYIAQDMGKDAVRFQNPILPQTHSEIALPLRSGRITIGALDIQTEIQSAFEERDANILQLLADQVAAAIENAQLAQQVKGTFTELNNAYSLQTQNVWQSAINKRKHSAFEYDGMQVQAIPQDLPNNLLKQLEAGKPIIINSNNKSQASYTEAKNSLLIPLMVRNQVIGVLGLEQENSNRSWTDEEIAIAQAAANRAALTLENARLLEESQRRAVKERTIFESTARIGSALSIENILQATAEELEKVLSGSEVVLQFQSDFDQKPEK